MKRLVTLFIIVVLGIIFAIYIKSSNRYTDIDTNTFSYDLGEGILQDGKELTYEMQGVIGIPEEAECPVAMILHGCHYIESITSSRYDEGFSYLISALADAGYFDIALNININYSFTYGEPTTNVSIK